MSSWDDLKKEVEENKSVLSITMLRLKDISGSGRLGIHVISDMQKELAGCGIGHVPQKLPNSQDQVVRLYKKGTDVGDFIELVLTPGAAQDKKIVETLSSKQSNYLEIVQQIRDLIDDCLGES